MGIASIRMTGFVVFRALLPSLRFQSPRILEDLLISFGYAIFALSQLRHAGVDIPTIFATSAVVTAVLAFSMQDTLGNLLGGIAVQLDNSIQIGDFVKIDDVVGKVVQIQWRSTHLETPNWETVVIPNSRLMKGQFTVLGKRQNHPVQWRRWIKFAVDPKTPPAKVIEQTELALLEANIRNLSQHPHATCAVLGFEEGNIHYVVRYFLNDIAEDIGTDSTVRVCIFNALQRQGIRIAEPQRTSNIVSHDEEHFNTVQTRDQARKLTMLKRVDIFQTLTEDELMQVVHGVQYAPFAKGDWLTRQGKTAHWLYLIASGEAEIIRENGNGNHTKIAELTTGQFFGEMGLMTGEPRSASVLAKTDLECYRVDKETFQALLLERPKLAEEITQIMAARQELTNHLIQADARPPLTLHPQRELLNKVRAFFGLKD